MSRKTFLLLIAFLWAVIGLYIVARLDASAQTLLPVSTNAAVCKISKSGSGGSGTLVGLSGDGRLGLVITAHHVVGASGTGTCTFRNVPAIADKRWPARVVRSDRRYDLAAMLIYNPGVPPVVIGDLQRHDGVYSACGYGGGRYSAARGPCYRFGDNLTYTRCGIWPGHSGGALFDPFGGYCGVTNWNNGSNGPNPNGYTRARSGPALDQFLRETSYQCGIFFRRRNRSGGYDVCPPGGCPPTTPGATVPGQGYGSAPEYQNLTPQLSPTQPPQQAIVQPQANPYVIQATPAAPDQALPIAQQQPAPQPTPVPLPATPAQPIVVEQERSIVIERKIERLEQQMTLIAEKLGVEQPEAQDPSAMIDRIPVVTLTVAYPDRREQAELNLAEFVREQLGAGN